MTEEAVKLLIQTLAIHTDTISKLRNQVAALEKAISQAERPLYSLYQTKLQVENRDSSPLLSQEELANLAVKFRQK